MQTADRGLKDVLTRTIPDARALEAHRKRGYELSVRIIERAQAEGTLRPDMVPEDLVLLLMANAGVLEATGTVAPAAPKRFIALLLDGLRNECASELPPPPSPRQMVQAMRGLKSRGTR
jgi:hypothetical protein